MKKTYDTARPTGLKLQQVGVARTRRAAPSCRPITDVDFELFGALVDERSSGRRVPRAARPFKRSPENRRRSSSSRANQWWIASARFARRVTRRGGDERGRSEEDEVRATRRNLGGRIAAKSRIRGNGTRLYHPEMGKWSDSNVILEIYSLESRTSLIRSFRIGEIQPAPRPNGCRRVRKGAALAGDPDIKYARHIKRDIPLVVSQLIYITFTRLN